MIISRNELFYKVLAGVFSVIMLWLCAAVIDHSLVFEFEKRPVFCISFNADESGGIYNGIGYSYEIIAEKGKFVEVDFENFLHANEYMGVSYETR